MHARPSGGEDPTEYAAKSRPVFIQSVRIQN